MKRMLLAVVVMAASLAAQPKENVTKLVQLHYADANAVSGVLGMFGVTVVPNPQLKAVTIAGPPDKIAGALEAIAKLDVAPKNIELVVHFLVGSNQPSPGAIPADLSDVVKQLKNTFAFKEYSLLDTLTLRTRAGSAAETSGVLDAPGTVPRLTRFQIRSATVSENGSIRIDRLHAGLRIPVSSAPKVDYIDTGVDQDIDVKEGQKVVVGRASLEGPAKALFVVLTAKVAQ